MAASSAAADGSSDHSYHAFLSFRGADIRYDFGDWLYHALLEAGLYTFRDDEDINKGTEFELEIEKAISESKVAVIVFSEDFANSSYCLDEVAMFMERRRRGQVEVLPVFFKVDPDDVCEVKGKYGEWFKIHEDALKESRLGEVELAKKEKQIEEWRDALLQVPRVTGDVYAKGYWSEFISDVVDEVKRKYGEWFKIHEDALKKSRLGEEELAKKEKQIAEWRAALQQVPRVTGHVYTKGYWSEFIRGVVDDARRLANPVTLDIPSHVVGKPYRFLGLDNWVQDQSHDKRIALLHGAYGMGKKTIAAVVSNQHYKDFDATAFLDNIAEKSKQPDGIVKLQSQLLSRLRKPKGNKDFTSEMEGKAGIRDGLKNKRVLIVLADLDQPQQFSNFIQDPGWLEKGSKVIVTSGNEKLLQDHLCEKFRVRALTPAQSLELFSWHAFREARPVEECGGHVMVALRYSCGIPSVIKAFASSLSFSSIDHWQELLPTINEEQELSIYRGNDLKARVDSLEKDDKKLFCDIACFYAGWDHDHVVSVLNYCRFYKKGAFDRLQRRHLVSIDRNNKVTMDQPIIEMGRDIVRQKTDLVGKFSNIWSHDDAFQLLRKSNGTEHIRSFILDGNQRETYSARKMEFQIDAFKGMTELKLLQLVNVKLKGDYKDFPKYLVWLSWEGMSLNYMPSNICLNDVVILDLRNSCLHELWNGSPFIRKLQLLKILNLSNSHLLEQTPDFSRLDVPNLVRLILEGCFRIVEIHSSIEVLRNLAQLNLKGCTGLEELPMLGPQVKLLDISGCTGLRMIPRRIESVEELCADQIVVDQLRAAAAEFLFCAVFPSLVKLSLMDCKLSDEEIIGDLVQLRSLQDLNLSRNLFTSLPEVLGEFSLLRALSLEECECLEVVKKLPNGLHKLSLINCKSLKKIGGVVKPAMNLFAVGCTNLVQIGEASRSEAMQSENVEMINNLKLYNWESSAASYEIEIANIQTGTIRKTPLQEQQLQFDCGILGCFVRGSEVPEWYDHQTEDTSLMMFVEPSEPGRRIIGINLCVVYRSSEHYTSFPIHAALSLANVSKKLYWEYSPVAYAKGSEEEMMWLSHWKLAGHIAPGDGFGICVTSPSVDVEVTRFGICWAYDDEAISGSAWYRKLDVELSTYEKSPGHFDLTKQHHRCVMSTGLRYAGDFFFNTPTVKQFVG